MSKELAINIFGAYTLSVVVYISEYGRYKQTSYLTELEIQT